MSHQRVSGDAVEALVKAHNGEEVVDFWRRLAAADFAGPEYDLLVLMLVRYAMAVLRGWIISGRIYGLCSGVGRPVPGHDGVSLSPTDVDTLVDDAVADGLRLFRKKARDGSGWKPGHGASMSTYFVKACVLNFTAAYRRWLKEQNRTEVAVPDSQLALADEREALAAAQLTELDERIDQLLVDTDEVTREITSLLLDGFTQAQVGERLGITTRQVETKLSKLRRSLRGHRRP